jgi:hypothetical protein
LHSARQLLGLLKDPAPRSEPAPEAPAARQRRVRTPEPDDGGASIETKVLAAVRQIQTAAGAETEQMRAAIRQAIAILSRALGS